MSLLTTISGPISATSDSDAWLKALRTTGPRYDQAVSSLHGLLLRGAQFEVGRRRAAASYVRGDDPEDVAMQAADDATVAVLGKLDDFRGASRFTTWAYKFALLEASARLRRRAWQNREVVLESESWTQLVEHAAAPDTEAEQDELLEAISDCIGDELTPHQRTVLVALAIDGVPIDVLAERLNNTRGALYKTLHDARRKLRAAVAARGFPVEATA
jgi:RNA polymerase sigma-70 factor (ECF subfamily)